jgi:hypothetical protein
MFSNAHTMLLLTTFLAKPMFKVNKPLFNLEQTMDMTWQNIPWLVAKYFAMSQNNIHVTNKYIKKFHDMECILRFLHVHLSRLACSCSPTQPFAC